MTHDELKALLSSPLGLFVIMLMASFINGWKQVNVANRQSDDIMLLREYFKHKTETVVMLLANALAFATLILTDQLNFASALGIGYGVNSAVDLARPKGRSASLPVANKIDAPTVLA